MSRCADTHSGIQKEKTHIWFWIVLTLVVFALLIPSPFPIELDDGGTVIYRAALWSVEKQHRFWQESDNKGHMVGTVISVLSFELYNDVVFVPTEE